LVVVAAAPTPVVVAFDVASDVAGAPELALEATLFTAFVAVLATDLVVASAAVETFLLVD
jgi:hypothetical protein